MSISLTTNAARLTIIFNDLRQVEGPPDLRFMKTIAKALLSIPFRLKAQLQT